jgi:uncharacterized SAM-binding protein YcdF (DUF218 family)
LHHRAGQPRLAGGSPRGAAFPGRLGTLAGLFGWSGKAERTLWQEPEAQKFAKIALEAGVAKDRILIEDRSTNTGENIRFSRELLNHKGLQISSALLVHKPYMERRSLATALKLWPGIRYCVSSPNISIEDYPDHEVSFDQMIAIIVGDFQRILKYPRAVIRSHRKCLRRPCRHTKNWSLLAIQNQMLFE